jgi:hypothetical protein
VDIFPTSPADLAINECDQLLCIPIRAQFPADLFIQQPYMKKSRGLFAEYFGSFMHPETDILGFPSALI